MKEQAVFLQGPSLRFIDVVTILARRRLMILLMTIAAAAVSVIYAVALPNVYSSTAMILPAQQDSGAASSIMAQLGGLAGLAGDISGRGTTSDLYSDILKSESIQESIVDKLGLMRVYGTKYKQEAFDLLSLNTDIEIGKKSGIVSITVDDLDPKRSSAIANAYVQELEKVLVGLTVSGAGQNKRYLEERLSKAKNDLAQAEDALKDFQSKNTVLDVSEQAKASIQGIATLRAQLAVNETQLATLRQSMTDNNPEVRSVKTTIDSLRSQIAGLEGGKGGGAIPSAGAMPALGQGYVRLMRDFKVQETIVDLLTKQYEMSKLAEAKTYSPVQVIQNGRIPEVRSKPARSKIVIVSTITAFLFAVIIAFVLENFAIMSDEDRTRWKSLGNFIPIVGKRISQSSPGRQS